MTSPPSGVSGLGGRPAHSSLSGRLSYQTGCRGNAMPVFKSPLFEHNVPKAQQHGAAIQTCHREAIKCMDAQEKDSINAGLSTTLGFGHPLGVLDGSSVDNWDYCIAQFLKRCISQSK